MAFSLARKIFTSLSLFATLVVAPCAQAEDWKNIGPITSGEMSAFVDFQVTHTVPSGDIWAGRTPQGPTSFEYTASPLWVNIRRDGLSSLDHVFVQIISYETSCYRGQCHDTQTLVERNLEFAESGRFTGEMNSLLLDYQLNNGYALSRRSAHRQELVVWINGHVYQGPHGENLRFSMTL
jgi:hypothetical protein